jgi:hypothetical protein
MKYVRLLIACITIGAEETSAARRGLADGEVQRSHRSADELQNARENQGGNQRA